MGWRGSLARSEAAGTLARSSPKDGPSTTRGAPPQQRSERREESDDQHDDQDHHADGPEYALDRVPEAESRDQRREKKQDDDGHGYFACGRTPATFICTRYTCSQAVI